MDPRSAALIREGDVLAGKYRIDKVLGQGGMGVVVAAHHLHLDAKVAIKFLLPEMLESRETVARFAREARAAVKIKNEHVARVSDVGTLPNGAPYMVMEYLEGVDLSAWLEQRGPLPVEQAVEFQLQACEAIAEAHALGIVHRDLKPANLFVIRLPDGLLSVKVLDFGISKMNAFGGGLPDAAMTSTTAVMGSPLYMSPEQLRSSKDVDARGDIWSLGVILYELLAGTPPFQGDSMAQLVAKILADPPAPISKMRPDVPPGLDAVIARCLDKDRGKRFQTVGELAVALLSFAPKRSKSSVERISGVMKAAGFSGTALQLPPSSDPSVIRSEEGSTAASFGKTAPPTPRTRHIWIATGIGGCALAVVAVAVGTRSSAPDAPALAVTAAATPTAPIAAATAPAIETVVTVPKPASSIAPASSTSPESVSPAVPRLRSRPEPARLHPATPVVAPSPPPPPAAPAPAPAAPHHNPLDIQPQ